MCGIAGMHERGGRQASTPRARGDARRDRPPRARRRGPAPRRRVALGARRLSIIDLRAATSRSPTRTARSSSASTARSTTSARSASGCCGPATRCARRATPRSSSTSTRSWATTASTSSTGCSPSRSGTRGASAAARPRPPRDQAAVLRPTTESALVFGSEIKAILRHPDVDARLDLDALAAFLLLKYAPAPRTMFAGIAALPPGHCSCPTTAASGAAVVGRLVQARRPRAEDERTRPTSCALGSRRRCAASSSATCRSGPSSAAASTRARSSRS